MKKLLCISALALATLASGAHAADAYPNKPIRLIVPYVAGGAADITARVLGQVMGESMGVPIVVENRPGANGGIGTDFVAKAPADGYTLLLDASGPIVVNPVLYKKIPYDPVKDLAPISLATSYQYVLEVLATSPIHSVQDLIAAAKAKPGELSYGSTGVGGGGHLAGELFGLMTHTKLNHIPYKGAAPALADMLGGQLSFIFDTVVTSVPHIKSGKLRPFAVTGTKRSASLPDLPTMEEIGMKGFVVTQFQGFFAPAKTDPAIIDKIHGEVVKALKNPAVIKRLADEGGNEIVASTPQEFAKAIQSDLALYGKLIKDANIQAE